MGEARLVPCVDAEWIAALLNEPDVAVAFEDGTPRLTASMVSAALRNGCEFMAAQVDGERIGGWLLEFGPAEIEVHTAISKRHRGRGALGAAKALANLLFEKYPIDRLITQVPQPLKAAAFFARAAGMHRVGHGKAFTYNGHTAPMILFEMRRDQCQ